MTTDRRRSELDVLRLVVVIGLVFFHAALVFDANDDFYVKNSETTGVTTVLAGFGVDWAMPLLFTVAGIGAWYSMAKRGPDRFAGAAAPARCAVGVRHWWTVSPAWCEGRVRCCSRRCRSR